MTMGSTPCFGLVGDANLFMANHFATGCGGTFVGAAHEGGSVLMAQAYTQVTGQVGVATVTQGPGLTNCFHRLKGRRDRASPHDIAVWRYPRHSAVSSAEH